ncbi:type III toxin-antitoxin system ToxN/AbiQ family toxin, partial [Oribacterium sinus]
MVEAIKYGFYAINPDYLEYLNQIDSEVYYNPSYRNSIKPFVGIIVGIENYNYFIPISSAKEKHDGVNLLSVNELQKYTLIK